MIDENEASDFINRNPDIEVLEAFVIDVNGVPRGKWIPRDRALDVLMKGMAIPRSVYALDIWGRDVTDAGLAEGTGDPNHQPLPTNWDYALQSFARSGFAYATLGPKYRSLYTACKRQELSEFSLRVTDVEYDAYIRTV